MGPGHRCAPTAEGTRRRNFFNGESLTGKGKFQRADHRAVIGFEAFPVHMFSTIPANVEMDMETIRALVHWNLNSGIDLAIPYARGSAVYRICCISAVL